VDWVLREWDCQVEITVAAFDPADGLTRVEVLQIACLEGSEAFGEFSGIIVSHRNTTRVQQLNTALATSRSLSNCRSS